MATTAPDVRVFPCPRCGAPLPAAADGAHVTCTACGATTTVETGGAAALAERASREEAEALFATLGEPPSWSQRVAVVLANPWLWLLLLPFALATLVRVAMVIQEAIAVAWERATGDRLMHVAAPPVQWLLSMGLVAAVALLLLVWSLLGKRVDARRELQAALACKPPETPGGPSGCRHCGAPLTVPPGALGVRCAYCGADNLVLLPAKWVDRAERATVALRLTAEAARERDERRGTETMDRRRIMRTSRLSAGPGSRRGWRGGARQDQGCRVEPPPASSRARARWARSGKVEYPACTAPRQAGAGAKRVRTASGRHARGRRRRGRPRARGARGRASRSRARR
jgi:LSD1 subclass zinc finger protein